MSLCQQGTVPVSREEVCLEREAITDARRGEAFAPRRFILLIAGAASAVPNLWTFDGRDLGCLEYERLSRRAYLPYLLGANPVRDRAHFDLMDDGVPAELVPPGIAEVSGEGEHCFRSGIPVGSNDDSGFRSPAATWPLIRPSSL